MPPTSGTIGNKIKGVLGSLFGGAEEEDPEVVAAAPSLAAAPSADGVVNYAPLRQQLQQQIDRLKADRGDKADMFLAFASGLGRPTKTGSFGESIGYATEALAKQSAESAKARDARRDMLMKYGIDLATLDVEEQKNVLAAGAKAGTAPRPVTEADIAKFGKTISAATHYMSDGKPVLIPTPTPVPKDEPTQTKLVGAILQKIIDKQPITPEEQKVLDFVTASGTPTGFVKTPAGRLQVDPGYVAGQGRLTDARRAPPKAAPPQPDNPAILLREGKL
jgi:hypothetical protein